MASSYDAGDRILDVSARGDVLVQLAAVGVRHGDGEDEARQRQVVSERLGSNTGGPDGSVVVEVVVVVVVGCSVVDGGDVSGSPSSTPRSTLHDVGSDDVLSEPHAARSSPAIATLIITLALLFVMVRRVL